MALRTSKPAPRAFERDRRADRPRDHDEGIEDSRPAGTTAGRGGESETLNPDFSQRNPKIGD